MESGEIAWGDQIYPIDRMRHKPPIRHSAAYRTLAAASSRARIRSKTLVWLDEMPAAKSRVYQSMTRPR